MSNRVLFEDYFERSTVGSNWTLYSINVRSTSIPVNTSQLQVEGNGTFWDREDGGAYLVPAITLPDRVRINAKLHLPNPVSWQRFIGLRSSIAANAKSFELLVNNARNRITWVWRDSDGAIKRYSEDISGVAIDGTNFDILIEYDRATSNVRASVLIGDTYQLICNQVVDGMTLVEICSSDSAPTRCSFIQIVDIAKWFSLGDSLSTIRQADTNTSQASGVYSPDGLHWIRQLIQSTTELRDATNDLTTNFARAGAYATIEHTQAWSAINPIPNFNSQITQLINAQTIPPDFDKDWVSIFFGTNDGGSGAAGTRTYSEFLTAIQNGIERLRIYGFKNYIIVAPENRYFTDKTANFTDYETWVATFARTNNLRMIFVRASDWVDLEVNKYTDGVHFTPGAHQNLARGIARQLQPRTLNHKTPWKNYKPSAMRPDEGVYYAENGFTRSRLIIEGAIANNLYFDSTWTTGINYPSPRIPQRKPAGKFTISPTQANGCIAGRTGYAFAFGSSLIEMQGSFISDTPLTGFYLFFGLFSTIPVGTTAVERGLGLYADSGQSLFFHRWQVSPSIAQQTESAATLIKPGFEYQILARYTPTSGYCRLTNLMNDRILAEQTFTNNLPAVGTMLAPAFIVAPLAAASWRNVYLTRWSIRHRP